MYLIAAYATNGAQKEFIPDLNNLFKQLQLNLEKNYFVLAGDLNAKHTNWLNCNPRGISLNKWIEEKEFRYKLKLYCTKFPSYSQGRSHLDVIVADARIDFIEASESFKLPSIPYDSDHNAVISTITLTDGAPIEIETQIEEIRYNFRKVNWKKFAEKLVDASQQYIPHDRNLSLKETITHLKETDNIILTTMNKIVPKISSKNSTDPYITPQIKELQKLKSHILTQLHKAQRK